MDKICYAQSCPRYFVCKTTERPPHTAALIDFRELKYCDEDNNFKYFEQNDATVKSLNDFSLRLYEQYKKEVAIVKAAIDFLLEEEEQHDSERKPDT